MGDIVQEAGEQAAKNMLSAQDVHDLGVSSDDIQRITNKITKTVGCILGKPGIFSGGKIKLKSEHEERIIDAISDEFFQMNKGFTEASKKVLEGKIGTFLKDVFDGIQSDSSISESAKKTLMRQVSAVDSVEGEPIPVSQIMKEHRVTKKVLFKPKEYLKKEGFLDDLKGELKEALRKLTDDYKDAYKKKHGEIIERLKEEFYSRVEEYSSETKAKIQDKDAMMQLGKKLKEVSDSVGALLEQLKKKIWQRSME